MDYLKSPVAFRIRKVARYACMYGLGRTYVKMLGQLHMRKRFDPLPRMGEAPDDRQVAGIIGCGNYAFSTIAYFLRQRFGRVLRACMDIDIHRAASLSRQYRIPRYTSEADDLITDPKIRILYIASNHASHAEYAIEALRRGKSVYIEKPHVVSEDQLVRLSDAMERSGGKVFLGFNRPASPFHRIMKEHLDREGGTGMYNWFVVGHDLEPDHWYHKPEEGGRVLGNLCHWTDHVLRLVPEGTYPIRITPTKAGADDSDIAVSYSFGDGSIAVISYSTKGHAFEGVKESFHAHKGNCLISMEDYRTMTVEVLHRKKRVRLLFRDHGHRANITDAFENAVRGGPYDFPKRRAHIVETGMLFLKTKEALETDTILRIHKEEPGLRVEAAV